MNSFMLLVFAMLAIACALVIVPLIRGHTVVDDEPPGDGAEDAGRRHEPVATASVVIVLVALPLGALALYDRLSDGVPDEAALASTAPGDGGALPSIAEMATALEQRLIAEPEDRQGWEMLGRTYVALQRFADAARAYDRALGLAGDRQPGLLLDAAEAMLMLETDDRRREAATLVEEALDLQPRNRKGLWYGGNIAFERGDYRLARQRWQLLAADSPPEALVGVLNQRIAAASAALGEAAPEEPPADATAAAAAPPSAPDDAVAVAVTLAPELSGSFAPDSPLFVLARATAGGPPIAVVRRRADELPLSITLSDADAMIAGRTISSQESVEIVARIAKGGRPVASPGDLFGAVNYTIGQGDGVRIVIDSVHP